MSAHHGSCHCGHVRLVLHDTPVEAAECNCSICRRIAGLWHYTDPALFSAAGAEIAYRQGDCSLDTWHCPVCACTTHWTAVDPAYAKVGVNLRMFEPALWRDLPRRYIDGASF